MKEISQLFFLLCLCIWIAGCSPKTHSNQSSAANATALKSTIVAARGKLDELILIRRTNNSITWTSCRINIGLSPMDIATTENGDLWLLAQAGALSTATAESGVFLFDPDRDSFMLIATLKSINASQNSAIAAYGEGVLVGTADGVVFLSRGQEPKLLLKTQSLNPDAGLAVVGLNLFAINQLGELVHFNLETMTESPTKERVRAFRVSGATDALLVFRTPDGLARVQSVTQNVINDEEQVRLISIIEKCNRQSLAVVQTNESALLLVNYEGPGKATVELYNGSVGLIGKLSGLNVFTAGVIADPVRKSLNKGAIIQPD